MTQGLTITNGHKTKLTETQCYENLANAIILQAIKDYPSHTEDVERFFHSDLFSVLTNIHPDYIIKVCRSGAGKEIKGDGL